MFGFKFKITHCLSSALNIRQHSWKENIWKYNPISSQGALKNQETHFWSITRQNQESTSTELTEYINIRGKKVLKHSSNAWMSWQYCLCLPVCSQI